MYAGNKRKISPHSYFEPPKALFSTYSHWKILLFGPNNKMENFSWTFHEVTVRCPCGTCFKNSDAYLQHKRSCKNHAEETSIGSGPVSVNRKAHKRSLEASLTPALRNARDFHRNRPPKEPHPFRNEQLSLSARKQPTNTRWGPSGNNPSVVGSVFSAAEQRSPPPQCATKIHCTCGRTFVRKDSLDMHLRTSMAHQAERLHLAEKDFVPPMPNVVQPTTLNAPLHSAHSASTNHPGSTSYSKTSVAQVHQCDCGHSFETQRSLDFHKRDSLHHQRQTDDSSAAENHQQDSLTAALASMNLYSEITWIYPPAASLTCICGCIFSTQGAFDQHKADAARYAWFGDREAWKKRVGYQ